MPRPSLCYRCGMADPDASARNSDVYRAVRDRLATFRPKIIIDDIIEPGSLTVESSVLGGISFKPTDFQRLWTAFRHATNDRSEEAFDYYSMKPSKLNHFLKSAAALNLLDISYLATQGFGFREKWNGPKLDDRPLSLSDMPGYQPRFDKRFGGRFGAGGTGEKQMDLTSVHAALWPELCNIHIDNVGFVLRGIDGTAGMGPDAPQHLVDELLWKTYLAPHISPWVGDHITLNLPSSRTGYVPMVGVTLDLPEQGISVSATVTLKCNCLPGGQAEVDHIPDGFSVGVGFTKTMDWGGGGRTMPWRR